MKTILRRWGNSLAVRIPKAFAMHVGLASGEEVEISADADGLRITPARDLQALLDKVTPENIHGETMTEPPVGRELW